LIIGCRINALTQKNNINSRNMNKILVTGSSGTIGTSLCERLISHSYDYIGVDWKPNRWHKEINKKTIILDLRNSEEFQKLPDDIDTVVHLAANARVYNLVKSPDMARDNILTIYNMLEFIRKKNIKKIIYASSREVYGNSDHILHNESEAYVENCESSYTASKIAGEALIHSYQQCYGIDFIIIRFSNVYGKYDFSDRVIPLFIASSLTHSDIIIYGKQKILDFTYIDDSVTGIIKSIELFDAVKNEIYNIASQKGISIYKIAELITKYTNSKSKIKLGKTRKGEVTKCVVDISKAKAVLDYNPEVDIESGITKAVEWYASRIKDFLHETNRTNL